MREMKPRLRRFTQALATAFIRLSGSPLSFILVKVVFTITCPICSNHGSTSLITHRPSKGIATRNLGVSSQPESE
jgi:hypothetical protein